MGLVSPASHFLSISSPFFLLDSNVASCSSVKGGFGCSASLSLFNFLSTSSWLISLFILAGIPNLSVESNTCLVSGYSFCSPFARLFMTSFGLRPPLAAGLAPKLYYSSCTYFSDSFLVFFLSFLQEPPCVCRRVGN